MFSFIWHTVFYDPIYNILVFLIDSIPAGDVGLAVIITVVAVRAVLLPVALKASRANMIMQKIQPELKKLQETYKEKREELAMKMLEVYRREKIHPFSPILVMLIQLPLLLAVYISVRSLPAIKTELLYQFVKVPETVNMLFLGHIHMDGHNLILAILAGITMYIQTRITMSAMPKPQPKNTNEPNFAQDMQKNMKVMMTYVMPLMISVFGYSLTAVIPLYFVISNTASIFQELYVRKKLKTS